ncbi:MAG: hypothetical protein ACKV2V_01290 [Blastocatellia bacterium]
MSTAITSVEASPSSKINATDQPAKPETIGTANDRQSSRNRLLIIADSQERTDALRALIATDHTEITCLTHPEQLIIACLCGHDLAIIDVAPAGLVEILKLLRSSAGCEEISVLVDASRIAADATLIGVLPAYRAMPCSRGDLITLARRRIATQRPAYRIARRML